MYPHLSLLASLAGQSLAVLIGSEQVGSEQVDSELEKAKLILCLREQVEALTTNVTEARKQQHSAEKTNKQLSDAITAGRARLSVRDCDMQVFQEKLATSEDQLLLSKMKLEMLQEEGIKREAVYNNEKQKQNEALREERVGLMQQKVEKKRDDTENALLLRLINAEADKWKHKTLELHSVIDVQVREEAKNNVLLAIVNAQLIGQREENNALRKEVGGYREEITRKEEQLQDAEERREQLLRLKEQQSDYAITTEKEHHFKIMRRKAHESRQQTLIESSEVELKANVTEIESYTHRASLGLKTAYEKQADLTGQCNRLIAINNDLKTALRETEEIETSRYVERKNEITKLATRRETVAKKMELADMKRFEEMVSNDNSINLLKSQVEVLSKKAKAFGEKVVIKQAGINDKIESARATAAAIRLQEMESDTDNFKTITKIIAANECLRNQIVVLEKTAAARNEAHIQERIEMAEQLAKYKKMKGDLEEGVRDKTTAHEGTMADLRAQQLNVSEKQVGAEEVQHTASHLRERCIMVDRETGHLTKHLHALEKEAMRSMRFFEGKCNAYESEGKVHKNEIARLARTVSRLEVRVAETQEYRTKAEENTKLEGEIKEYKKEQRYLQNVISTMTVEKGLLDGYKAKVLTEQNESQLQKLKSLEGLKARYVPLLKELLATARKHDIKSDAIKNAERAALELGISCYHTPAPPKALWASHQNY